VRRHHIAGLDGTGMDDGPAFFGVIWPGTGLNVWMENMGE